MGSTISHDSAIPPCQDRANYRPDIVKNVGLAAGILEDSVISEA
jgi:hypothetical protein